MFRFKHVRVNQVEGKSLADSLKQQLLRHVMLL